ncbi:hypothetical protein [Tsuneonella suprasediminis]|uniref:hypothetical protein n=1 Tax=Tsuneonella suprasediminis TaxID=2306996 RepID=UPI002F92EBB4
MSFFSAAVAIVAIIAFSVMRIVRYNTEHRGHRDNPAPENDAEKAALRHEVENLRERVRVLERIATDANSSNALDSRRVADEIEALRDR